MDAVDAVNTVEARGAIGDRCRPNGQKVPVHQLSTPSSLVAPQVGPLVM